MIQQIRELIKGFGYELDFADIYQCKERYSNELGFIDLWDGR